MELSSVSNDEEKYLIEMREGLKLIEKES